MHTNKERAIGELADTELNTKELIKLYDLKHGVNSAENILSFARRMESLTHTAEDRLSAMEFRVQMEGNLLDAQVAYSNALCDHMKPYGFVEGTRVQTPAGTLCTVVGADFSEVDCAPVLEVTLCDELLGPVPAKILGDASFAKLKVIK